jgi:hypothetical protein
VDYPIQKALSVNFVERFLRKEFKSSKRFVSTSESSHQNDGRAESAECVSPMRLIHRLPTKTAFVRLTSMEIHVISHLTIYTCCLSSYTLSISLSRPSLTHRVMYSMVPCMSVGVNRLRIAATDNAQYVERMSTSPTSCMRNPPVSGSFILNRKLYIDSRLMTAISNGDGEGF